MTRWIAAVLTLVLMLLSGATAWAQPPATRPGGAPARVVPNLQTGTTYTVLNDDLAKLVTFTNGSAVAVTLPQAGASSQFVNGWYVFVENRGAGTVTITPTTSQIDGGASLALTTDQGALIASNGSQYFTFRGRSTTPGSDTWVFFNDGGKPGAVATVSINKTTGVISAAGYENTGATRNHTEWDMLACVVGASSTIRACAHTDGRLKLSQDGAALADFVACGGDLDCTTSNVTPTVTKASGAFALPGDISPTQLTGNVTDYNPTGLSGASTLRLSSDATRTINSLDGGADGRILVLHNIGAQSIVLLDDDGATGTATMRFELGSASVTIAAGGAVTLRYDATSSRWRPISTAGSGSSGAPSDATYWTRSANGTLSAEENLGALGTGLVLNTSGVPSQYAGTSCTNQFPRSLNASGAATCQSVANTDLSNSSVTLNGRSVSLGGSMNVRPSKNFHAWKDDFIAGSAAGCFGEMCWEITDGSMTSQNGVANHPGIARISTGGSSGTISRVGIQGPRNDQDAHGYVDLSTPVWAMTWVLRVNEVTQHKVRFGMANQVGSDPPDAGFYFEVVHGAGAANWFCVNNAASSTSTDSTIASDTSWHNFEIRGDGTNIIFSIDGTQRCSQSTNKTTGTVFPWFQNMNTEAVDKTVDIDYVDFYLELTR